MSNDAIAPEDQIEALIRAADIKPALLLLGRERALGVGLLLLQVFEVLQVLSCPATGHTHEFLDQAQLLVHLFGFLRDTAAGAPVVGACE
jgi:hypothetical protein